MFIKDPHNNIRRRCDLIGEVFAPRAVVRNGQVGRRWTVVGAWRRGLDLRYLVRHADTGERRLVPSSTMTNLW